MTDFAMTRIDLRGRVLNAAALRSALPRGGVDVDSVVPKIRPIVEDVAARGAQAAPRVRRAIRWCRAGRSTGSGRRARDCPGSPDGDVRAALEVAIDRTRAVHTDQRRIDTITLFPVRRLGERTMGAGRAGRALCSGWQCGVPVERGDERRAGLRKRVSNRWWW